MRSLALSFFGIAALVATPFQIAQALSATDVSTIAEAITVRIDGQNSGSGVLIKRVGNIYTVLTAAHVVVSVDEYDVVTTDGQRYPLAYHRVKKFPNVDLALVQFTSSTSYPVADLGDSAGVKAGASIYVSGFPVPTAAITESIWNFSSGKVTANAKRPLADSYSLVYSNNTLPGMSGGAVLDNQGKLIGIHGRADAEQQVQKTETIYVKTGFNLGIPIHTFLNLIDRVNPNLGVAGKAAEPISLVSSELTADDWFLKAAAQHQNKDYRGAISNYNKAIASNPSYLDAYNNRGAAYASLQEYGHAIANYNKAITLDPTLIAAYYNRGKSYKILKDYSQAISDYNKAIDLDPKNASAYNNRGNAYYALKEYAKALTDYNQAIVLNPRSASAYNNRGLVSRVYKDYFKALKDFDQAIALNPEYAEAYGNRGLTYAFSEDYTRPLPTSLKPLL